MVGWGQAKANNGLPTQYGNVANEWLGVVQQIKNAKPGLLTEGLRSALGMADGSPPPWLINMQRYGPPPSYGDLKVPPTS